MKKLSILFAILMIAAVSLFAQTVTLTFTGQDDANHYVRLDSVVVRNLTQGWQETLFWPDTVLIVQEGTGIDDYSGTSTVSKIQLSQNTPNPFTGITFADMALAEEGKVLVEVTDMAGRVVVFNNYPSLQKGLHQLRISLSTPGVYFLTARMNGNASSVKMINQSEGGADKIEYQGMVEKPQALFTPKSGSKDSTVNPFHVGDEMEYVGFTTVNSIRRESVHIMQAQNESQTIRLTFILPHDAEPTVTTSTATNITTTSATLNGTVSNPDNVTITAQGFEWKVTQGGTYTIVSATGTSISYNLTGLASNTSYTYRAFVTTAAGTNYGGELTFTTTASISGVDAEPCPGTPTVTDFEGNTYNTVWIGNQCWMKENLRSTKYANGFSIALGSTTSQTTAYRYYPNNDSSNVSTYGYLYNWTAVMKEAASSDANPSGVQGICPAGWHVPSDAEWTQLTNYVSAQSQYQCNGSSTDIAKAMASTTGWYTSSNACAVGNDQSSNNATGFSAFPAGHSLGSYYGFGYYAYFWSSTECNSISAWRRELACGHTTVYRYGGNNEYGFSVRCVRD